MTARAKPKRQAKVELEVHDIALTGEGVARLPNGETVFIPGAIAGETIEAALIAGGRSPHRATLVRVINPSDQRSDPPCPYAARCGGCDAMHLAKDAQAEWQRRRVRRALEAALGTRVPEPQLHTPVSPLGYRTRARLQIDSNGRHARIGYLAPRSHDLVTIDACAVLAPALAHALAELAQLFAPSRGRGEANAALGSRGARVYQAHWRGALEGETLRRLAAAIESGRVAGAQIRLDGASEPMVAGDPRPMVVGADGIPLVIAVGGFSQASDAGGAALAARVAELAQGSDKAVELFAGSGTITVALARAVGSLVAVERDDAAIAALRENLKSRKLEVRLRHDDADAIAIPKVDVVVLDPPRAGAAGAVNHIVKARPRRVIYVSCNTATLARDLATLAAGGYALGSLDLYDLFPQTSHVEVVASLARA